MGLAEALDYHPRPRNRVHSVLAWLMSTSAGAWLAYHLAAPLDRVVLQWSGGRTTISQWFAGVPPIWVSATGAQTGLRRTTPLFGIPFRGDLALIGTGAGQGPTPAWVRNLSANPDCTVSLDGHKIDAVARIAKSEESDEIWERGAELYPGFPKYRARLTREVKLFVLTARDG